MAYIGKNPRLKSIVSQGDTLANLTAEPRVAGRLVYATDEGKFYFDDGVALTAVGSGAGGGIPLLAKGSLLTSDGSNNGELSVGTDGQALKANSSATSGINWESILEVPSGGTTGQILTKTAGGYAWQDASGGGMKISTIRRLGYNQSYTIPTNLYGEANSNANQQSPNRIVTAGAVVQNNSSAEFRIDSGSIAASITYVYVVVYTN